VHTVDESVSVDAVLRAVEQFGRVGERWAAEH
jgi:succinyl-diaminopimelate desuccinylase